MLLTVVLVGGSRSHAGAQDLEPRAYAATPIGTMFVVLAVGRSSGGVFFDPSLHVEDVQATLGAATFGLGYTFDLFSRTALIVGTMPYARGTASGSIQESTREATRTGWADARLKLSVNLLGGRALRSREFVKARRSPIVGLSVTTVLPVGRYRHGNRLMNLDPTGGPGSPRPVFRSRWGAGRSRPTAACGCSPRTITSILAASGANRLPSSPCSNTSATRCDRVCGWPSTRPGMPAARRRSMERTAATCNATPVSAPRCPVHRRQSIAQGQRTARARPPASAVISIRWRWPGRSPGADKAGSGNRIGFRHS